MRCLDPLPRAAAQRGHLPEPMRYLAQRWVQLLDSDTSLVSSVFLTVSAPVTLRRAVSLAYAHHRDKPDRPSYGVLYDALQSARHVLRDDRNLLRWWPAETKEAERWLRKALTPPPDASKTRRRARFFIDAFPAARRGVSPLLACVDDDDDGYRRRLTDLVLARLDAPLVTYGDWESFDADIRRLAALIRDEGRVGNEVSYGAARAIADATDAATARAAFAALLAARPSRYEVVLAVSGASAINVSSGAFGCRVLDAHATWRVSVDHEAEEVLRAYVRRHEHERRTAVAVEAQAWDVEHALRLAGEKAERLLAQLGARHRSQPFAVHDDLLILCQDRGFQHSSAYGRPPVVASPLLEQPRRLLDEPIQLLRLAQQSRLPVLSAVQCWIALEALADGAAEPAVAPTERARSDTAYDVLGAKLPRALALRAFVLGLMDLWDLVSAAARSGRRADDFERIATWIGTDDRHHLVDPNRWFDLVAADPSTAAPPTGPVNSAVEASALLEDMRADLGPFASRSVWRWRLRLQDNGFAAQWSRQIERDLADHFNHLYMVRNAAVHNGVLASEGARSRTQVALLILDVAVEVIADWVPTSHHLRAGRGLDGLDARARHIFGKWESRGTRPVYVDLARLTAPGGDGLDRTA